MTHENPFAFPCVAFDATGDRHWQEGMDLRDWFATHAPEPPPTWWGHGPKTCEGYALWGFQYADAMLAARTGDTK